VEKYGVDHQSDAEQKERDQATLAVTIDQAADTEGGKRKEQDQADVALLQNLRQHCLDGPEGANKEYHSDHYDEAECAKGENGRS